MSSSAFQEQMSPTHQPNGKFARGHKLGNRFKPGQSGNPGGRPKGTGRLDVEYLHELEADPNNAKKRKAETRAQKIAKALVAKAEKGDVKAAAELADRTLGKAPQFKHVDKDITIRIIRDPAPVIEVEPVEVKAIETESDESDPPVSLIREAVSARPCPRTAQ